jgi:hypothetical protein
MQEVPLFSIGSVLSLPPIAAKGPGPSGRFCQESKIGAADAAGALDGFWPDPDNSGGGVSGFSAGSRGVNCLALKP